MSTDLATDIEPVAQTDAQEYNCRFHTVNGVNACAQAFYIIQAHHDYCPHDTLTRYEEELFHEWESKCEGCTIRRKYNAALNACPVIDCSDTTVAQLGYSHLQENCVAADTTYAFEFAGVFDTPGNAYTWVSQGATVNTSLATNYTYADAEMKIVAIAMTNGQVGAPRPQGHCRHADVEWLVPARHHVVHAGRCLRRPAVDHAHHGRRLQDDSVPGDRDVRSRGLHDDG